MGGQEPNETKDLTTIGSDADAESANSPQKLLPDVAYSLAPGDAVGRYVIKSVLGSGGFGAVYLAIDLQLNRDVAIKVPLAKYTHSDELVDRYLSEARLVAQLDHPNIVTVFDSGRDDKAICFFVTKFIQGQALATILREQRPDFVASVKICRDIAGALHYAHLHGVIHRDVKPGNIIVEDAGRPYLIDFGLAMQDDSYRKGSGYVGTPAFMSPEQARGEGHLVDGRSDVYSLGVVLYRMISGRMPSSGGTREEVLESVAFYEPKPPRQIDDSIPRELENICLRAMSKRASDRYTTAKDFADDLGTFLREQERGSGSQSDPKAVGHSMNANASSEVYDSGLQHSFVVPKGLRAFDEDDSEFFLSLLPGPVDRLGVPERIRFLKRLVEDSRVNSAQPVGVIYGPSGCGKSSLIRAGLMPRLSKQICPVIIEATGEDTEATIVRALRRLDPELRQARSLAEVFARIRLGQTRLHGRKVVILLDQFEQWLNARTDFRLCELVAALRQCDGIHLQCLLSVRDDFWVPVSRLLREVEVEVREGQNAAMIDLFDVTHARRVLMAIGRAYGRLPQTDNELSRDHHAFIDRAIEELSERRRVVPVRLAVFAEMMKDKQWCLKNLEFAGGSGGIGAAFLHETFNVPDAPTRQKRHATSAQRVLAMLIPKSGADLKGSHCKRSELREVAGYRDPHEFDDLMTLLDKELRLLTPVAQLGDSEYESSSDKLSSEPAYQLTHDYLVAPLHTWLAQQQRGSIAGRARLRLEETSGFWALHRDRKLLPTVWEWVFLRLFVPRRSWTETQRLMMASAGRVIGWRALALLAVGCCIALLVNLQVRRIESEIAFKRLLAVPVTGVRESIESLRAYGKKAVTKVEEAIQSEQDTTLDVSDETPSLSQAQFRLRLASAVISKKRDTGVEKELLRSDAETVRAISDLLDFPDAERDSFFWDVLTSQYSDDRERLRAACFLAKRSRADSRWSEIAPRLALTLAAEPFVVGEQWTGMLMPVSTPMLESISDSLVSEPNDLERTRLVALIQIFCEGDAQRLVRLRQIASGASDPGDGEALRRQATASAVLVELGDWTFAIENLQQSSDPTLRTQTVATLEDAEIDLNEYLKVLQNLSKTTSQNGVRAGLLSCLGEFDTRRVTPAQWQELFETTTKTLADPDANEEAKSVCHWLHSRWKQVREDCPEAKPSRMIKLTLPHKKLSHIDLSNHIEDVWTYEILSCAVTVEEFLKFQPEHLYDIQTAPEAACPINEVTWFDAVAYCNWLSEKNGLDRDQWCYVVDSNATGTPSVEIPDNIHDRRGFRLPTSTEWEHAIRAGTDTRWSWGRSDSLAGRFAWTMANSGLRTHCIAELRPNPFGLFDMNGNVWEWLHDTPEPSGTSQVGTEPRFLRGGTYLNAVESVGFDSVIANPPEHKTGADGFRVVRRVVD